VKSRWPYGSLNWRRELNEVLDEHRGRKLSPSNKSIRIISAPNRNLDGPARGVILLEAARRDLKIVHLPSTTVKRHVTGMDGRRKNRLQRAGRGDAFMDKIPEPPDVATHWRSRSVRRGVLRRPTRDAMLNDDLLSR